MRIRPPSSSSAGARLPDRERSPDDAAEPPATRRRMNPPEAALTGLPMSRPPPPAAAQPGTSAPPRAAKPAYDSDLAWSLYPELTKYLQKREVALESDTVAQPWDIKDIRHLPTLIEGLNLADDGLKLDHYHLWNGDVTGSAIHTEALADRLQAELGTGGAWRAVIDYDEHRTAMSVQCSATSNDVSIVLVDSSTESSKNMAHVRQRWADVLNEVTSATQKRLGPGAPPVRLHMTLLASRVHKGLEGCTIFALSAAKKMASEGAIRELHTSMLDDVAQGRAQPGVEWQDARQHLPPAFYKHATSRRVLEDYLGILGQRDPAAAEAAVNKRGKTLLQRYDDNFVSRDDPSDNETIHYSMSYEEKRVEIIKTALAHLTADRSDAGLP
jgi:hypothetical protein